jgi:sugar lactone lactonase YvrE
MELADLFETTEMQEVASGFRFTEGPVWHPAGYLLFSDIPASTIYRWTPGSPPQAWRSPSGNSNGLTFDRQGRLVACEHGNRRVSRTEADGTVVDLATHYQGKRLNSPNDVAVRSDGSVYFTDPPYGIKPQQQELPFHGVYRLAPDGKLELLVDDFDRPNGLAFSPDEKTLYIDDTTRRQIRAFDVAPAGSLSNGRLFVQMESEMEGGPDGMKVDVEGNIYCTGPGAVWVYRPDGALVGWVVGPQRPANLAFGGPDLKTLYITARTELYALHTRIAGVPVF